MSAQRILVVGPSWVGDMVMAQSLFKALRQRDPDVVIDVLAPAWSFPLLDRMPEVNEGIEMPLGHGKLGLGERWKLGKSLQGLYDQAILLPNSLKSAIVPFAAGIKQRTGWRGEMRYGLLNDLRVLDKSRYSMTVQRFVALAHHKDSTDAPQIEAPRLHVKVSDIAAALKRLQLQKQARRKVLALCPGAEYGSAKRWPEIQYSALASQYVADGWDVWLFGSEKDATVTAEINRLAGDRCVDLAGKTSLAEAVDLMSITDAVVSNDSGLMHVAAALNRPLVAVYGSSDPNFTPPLNKDHVVVTRNLPCSPCFERECPKEHLDCLKGIEAGEVNLSLRDLLR